MTDRRHDAASRLRAENEELRRRLEEAEDALRAIREGDVDAVIVSGSKGDRVFSLAESENLHRLMVETMNEAGIATSPDGTILYCNRRACALLQRSSSELVGQHLSEVVAPQHLDRISLLLDNASRGTTHDRVMFVAADDSPVPMQVWASRAETLEGPMISLVGTDLSLLEADQALMSHLEEQQRELRTREKELTEARDQLHQMLERRDNLVRQLEEAQRSLQESHLELEEKVKERTLLSEERGEKLRAMADALTSAEHDERRRLAQVLHDDLQQMLVAIRLRLSNLESIVVGTALLPTVRGISEIVDNAITSSRSLTVELSPPVLREPLPDMIEWLAHWFETRHQVFVEVSMDADLRDPSEEAKKFLFQAVRELILNVRKHSGTDHARVHIFSSGDDVGIEVRDDGKGFEPTVLKGSRTTFGLFNIQERAELMGGSFKIQSADGHGATCIITLPAVTQAPKVAPAVDGGKDAAAQDGKQGGPIRVLVVDDHTIFRRGLISILESYSDIKVVGEASDGEEGVRRAGDLLPDVVIMDLAMPRMNGIEATRVIKSRFMSIDVIALSFQESAHARASILEAGARAYFTKSGPLENLLRAIREHTGNPGAARPSGNGGAAVVPAVRPRESTRATTAHDDAAEARHSASRRRKA
jgi:PAS domain S-box-containing protein